MSNVEVPYTEKLCVRYDFFNVKFLLTKKCMWSLAYKLRWDYDKFNTNKVTKTAGLKYNLVKLAVANTRKMPHLCVRAAHQLKGAFLNACS